MEIKSSELLKDKKKLVETIHAVTKLQSQCIQEEDFKGFETATDQREEWIKQLSVVDTQLSSLELSQQEHDINVSIKDELQVICNIDKDNINRIKAMQQEIDIDFKQMNIAKKVVTQGYMNYAGMEQQPSYYIDQKK